MKENIRFKGLSFSRDEQQAVHGELSLCAGVELHDGALRASVLEGTEVPNKLLRVSVDPQDRLVTLKYVHETASYRHFVGVAGKGLYWFNADGTTGGTGAAIHTFGNDDSILSVNSNGNTLIVLAMSGVHYILWNDEAYKYLGQQPPLVKMEFRPTEDFKGEYDRSNLPKVHTEYVTNPETYHAWRAISQGDTGYAQTYLQADGSEVKIIPDKQAETTEAVWALINQTNNIIANDGHFYAPFMIRYCYRLFDGSMIMHSSPVFMDISLPLSYKVYCLNAQRKADGDHSIILYADTETLHVNETGELATNNGLPSGITPLFETNKFTFRYTPNNVGIQYRVASSSELTQLKDEWSDIVESIDIFITAPIVREESGKLIKKLIVEDPQYGVRAASLAKWSSIYGTIWNGDHYNDEFIFDIPKLSEDEYKKKIFDTSTFFKLKSCKLDDISTGSYQTLDYDKYVVPNITTQEQMIDDYHTHNLLLPISDKSGMYVYNHRLNLYGMKEQLFNGFSLPEMTNECSDTHHGGTTCTVTKVIVELDTEDGKKVVEHSGNVTLYPYNITKAMLFYPDARAKKMTLVLSDNSKFVLKMESLSFLNGAAVKELFWKDNLNDFSSIANVPAVSSAATVTMVNKVITSEVDNPFYFPLAGRNTVGVGSIIGLAAVTRALSQGQVGDHDLVVFSTDGIWVMKVSSEGTYMSTHNISREVCSNVNSICQLDQSIVFATQRGLSKFVESDVISISDELDGPMPVWNTLLPSLVAEFPAATAAAMARLLAFGTPAVQMFNSGRVFYDYASKRVVVLPSGAADSVSLVFSIRDQAWSTMCVPGILSIVPGYPSPFIQKNDGTVLVLDKQYDYVGQGVQRQPGVVITRTLTFSDTMDVLRGFRQYTDSASMPTLYFFGSNDQRSWKLIGKTSREFYEYLPGHPFRFFRIAVSMSLLPSEVYQQLELEVINKYAKLG